MRLCSKRTAHAALVAQIELFHQTLSFPSCSSRLISTTQRHATESTCHRLCHHAGIRHNGQEARARCNTGKTSGDERRNLESEPWHLHTEHLAGSLNSALGEDELASHRLFPLEV